MTMQDAVPISESVAPVEQPRQFDSPRIGLSLAEVDRLIRAGEARARFNVDGSDLTVAVLDTGLNTAHVDFAGRIRAQKNFTADNGGDPNDATDGNGHGTNVGGIIVANGDHRGVAPGASIIPIKVLSNSGSGSFAAVDQALQWVIDHHSEHSITSVCMSLGAGDNRTSDVGLSMNAVRERIRALHDLRIPVAIAAGNDFFKHQSSQGMSYPAIIRECVSVGAVYDEFEGPFSYGSGAATSSSAPDRITPFSQRLHESVSADCRTDVFAPGAPVTSSGIHGAHGESIQHGTSQATPVTVGAILLLQQLVRRTSGALPTVEETVDILRQGGVAIRDIADGKDNVVNTNLEFRRVSALGALELAARRMQRALLMTGTAVVS